ncbi:phospholipase D-like domain-containing protein [Bdellovibrionota bacterium FG-2]
MKQLIRFLMVCQVLLWSIHSNAVDVFFSPGLDCENQVVQGIKNAKHEVIAAVYAINNSRIVQALKEVHGRSVNIRVLTDRLQAAGKSSKVVALADAGLNIRVHSKFKIEHNKFVVLDGKTAISGSYNWTNHALATNSENCVLMPEANAVVAYMKRFEELWILNTQQKSDAKLAGIRKNYPQRVPANAR